LRRRKVAKVVEAQLCSLLVGQPGKRVTEGVWSQGLRAGRVKAEDVGVRTEGDAGHFSGVLYPGPMCGQHSHGQIVHADAPLRVGLGGPDDEFMGVEGMLDGSADMEQPGGVDVRPAQAAQFPAACTGDGGKGYGGGQDRVGLFGRVDQAADNGGVSSGLGPGVDGGR
jgi:hypothetical protein